jgi:hypothetical protein
LYARLRQAGSPSNQGTNEGGNDAGNRPQAFPISDTSDPQLITAGRAMSSLICFFFCAPGGINATCSAWRSPGNRRGGKVRGHPQVERARDVVEGKGPREEAACDLPRAETGRLRPAASRGSREGADTRLEKDI